LVVFLVEGRGFVLGKREVGLKVFVWWKQVRRLIAENRKTCSRDEIV
jgi:hypothetical protein